MPIKSGYSFEIRCDYKFKGGYWQCPKSDTFDTESGHESYSSALTAAMKLGWTINAKGCFCAFHSKGNKA